MTQTFLNFIAHWIQDNAILAVGASFLWGICSVLLSPCHLATVSILATPGVANSSVSLKVEKLMLGHVTALFITGLILIFFSYELDILGHYWTVPFGILFLYLALQLIQNKHCTHCHSESAQDSFLDRCLQKISRNTLGFLSFGFIYGILSSTCVLIFLTPVLFMAKSQSVHLLILLNLAFAIGHTLPIFIMGMLAKSVHKLTCNTDNILKLPRRLAAIFFVCLGLVLVAHPFLELMGFDFHGHEHGLHDIDHGNNKHDSHSHDDHNHDNHDQHNHDQHNHDQHDH